MLRLTLALAALAALLTSCTVPRAPTPADDRLSVFVSIPPQAYFVERVGGEHVAVHVLVGPGQSPATYEPSPAQMAELGEADAYFRIGVPFEAGLLPKVAAHMAELNVVDTRRGIELRHVEGSHDGEGDDPHIWLDPKLVKVQAGTIHDELARLDPDHAADYDANLAAFVADLDAVDARVAKALAPLRGRAVLVFHPSYGYFADAYGLRQVAVESEGKEPSARQLAETITAARAEGVGVIFVQREFSTRGAEAIAREIGATVVPLDPLARDYIANLERMAEAISKGCVQEGPLGRSEGPPEGRLRARNASFSFAELSCSAPSGGPSNGTWVCY